MAYAGVRGGWSVVVVVETVGVGATRTGCAREVGRGWGELVAGRGGPRGGVEVHRGGRRRGRGGGGGRGGESWTGVHLRVLLRRRSWLDESEGTKKKGQPLYFIRTTWPSPARDVQRTLSRLRAIGHRLEAPD